MKKVLAYAISIAGIFTMIVGFGTSGLSNPIFNIFEQKYIVVAGIATVIVGVFFALDSSKKKSKKKSNHSTGEDEIPIYEGTGKDRKVVGYRKD